MSNELDRLQFSRFRRFASDRGHVYFNRCGRIRNRGWADQYCERMRSHLLRESSNVPVLNKRLDSKKKAVAETMGPRVVISTSALRLIGKALMEDRPKLWLRRIG